MLDHTLAVCIFLGIDQLFLPLWQHAQGSKTIDCHNGRTDDHAATSKSEIRIGVVWRAVDGNGDLEAESYAGISQQVVYERWCWTARFRHLARCISLYADSPNVPTDSWRAYGRIAIRF